MKIAVITGTRAEYGLLTCLMREIQSDTNLTLQVIVTGTHLSDSHGNTVNQIEDDGFPISARIPLPLTDDSALGIASAFGVASTGFAKAFAELKPDLAVVLGDRYEILAAAVAAHLMHIPLAHIHGGETTEGAFDDALRHAITKLACVHFPAAEAYRQRIIQLGERPESVFCTGTPGLENLERLTLMSRAELANSLGLNLIAPVFAVTFHPVTREPGSAEAQTQVLLQALAQFPQAQIVFTQANADPENAVITGLMTDFVKRHSDRCVFFSSLGGTRYLSLLKNADVVIGNSSSGVIEAPTVGIPTVNIGDRQKGRLMADSILQCPPVAAAIENAIKQALSEPFRKKIQAQKPPYQGGPVAARIKKVLAEMPLGQTCLKKSFYDIPGTT